MVLSDAQTRQGDEEELCVNNEIAPSLNRIGRGRVVALRLLVVGLRTLLIAMTGISLASAQPIKLEDLMDVQQPLETVIEHAEANQIDAQLELATRYQNGKDTEQNTATAVYWLERAARQGSAAAMHRLGSLYTFGAKDIPANMSLALLWYENAARAGDAEAAYRRAKLGSPLDALNWHLRAATAGHSAAQYEAGLAYYVGSQTAVNYAEAARWFKASAQQRNTEALHMLAMMYRFGTGLAQDFREANLLFQAAANMGHQDAMLQVALATQNGRGIARDVKAAFEMIRALAAKGHVEATMELANCYENGTGTPKQPHVGHAIYNYLVGRYPQYSLAIQKRGLLAATLTPPDLEKSHGLTRIMLAAPNAITSLK